MNMLNEHAFETTVAGMLAEGGWQPGALSEWDQARALFPARVVAFIRTTQGALWDDMAAVHGDGLQALLIDALVKELAIKGSLYVLRHGFKCYGKLFRLACFKPAHGLSPEVMAQYAQNMLTVTRQVPCHASGNSTVDLLLSVNGLPVATIELKNPATGQRWAHAVQQYQQDRHPQAPLFAFKQRALVHFAADPDAIRMTTRLAGDKTFFLPFDRGSHPGQIQCGAGNPAHPSGYRTGYFWQDTLQRDSFLDILGHFMFVEKHERRVDDGRGGKRIEVTEAMIFPRYHQLDAVRALVAAARGEGAGRNYLIQHSAGSGKTNSISWLSHRLASLHDAYDQKVFDCVIVITDRKVLDRQLQDAIYQIEHAQGVVKAIDQDAKQLAAALIDGTKIVITTLQKFPFVLRGLLHAAGAETQERASADARAQAIAWQAEIAKRRYAVIVDEAHSSQTGETARELKGILGAAGGNGSDDDTGFDWEDRLNQIMASRGQQPNLSFFAFTATPKGKTLELFGRKDATGTPQAFHTYSMRQAIEEGFILDVLSNYTTYTTWFKLVKAVEDDPNLPKKKGAKALAKFKELHPHNIEQKTEVMIEHFRSHIRHQLGGRGKAMVVASSRLQAVRYKLAFDEYLKEHGLYDEIRPLVAFSGTVKDPETDIEYTEPGMNTDAVTGKPIAESQLPERFDSSDYQLLLVANKYQTGFDQPLLCAMYVDKRLDNVQAVQTLSRLNRKIAGKQDPFVLDFVNDTADIYAAFKPYFDATSLQESANPELLPSLKHTLDLMQIYHQSEVDAFAAIFYRLPARQAKSDHDRLHLHVQPAVDRFKALEDDDARTAFRDRLGAYVRMYGFLSQILPYADPDLEKLYSYGRLLLTQLPADRDDTVVRIGSEVELAYYRLQRVSSGPIDLRIGEPQGVYGPAEVGSGRTEEERAPLSEIIRAINDRFGTSLNEEDRLFFEQIEIRAAANQQMIDTAQANPEDKFKLGVRTLVEDMFIERMSDNDAITTRYLDDREFQSVVFDYLAKGIYKRILDQNRQPDR